MFLDSQALHCVFLLTAVFFFAFSLVLRVLPALFCFFKVFVFLSMVLVISD